MLTKALVADAEVPKVDAEIIGGDVGFLVRVDGYGMDVVCMSVGVDFAWQGRDDVLLEHHARKFEMSPQAWWRQGPLTFVMVRLRDDAQ